MIPSEVLRDVSPWASFSRATRPAQRIKAAVWSPHTALFAVLALAWIIFLTIVNRGVDKWRLICLVILLCCTYLFVCVEFVGWFFKCRDGHRRSAVEFVRHVQDFPRRDDAGPHPMILEAKRAYFERVCPASPFARFRYPGQCDSDGDDDDTCCVCLEHLADGGSCRNLSCGHSFHATCIDGWWVRDPRCIMNCPMCKRNNVPACVVEHVW
mmetsp:Transcript_77871/g.152850  ORF Transcript_77871/g.152850 Transcript_77871/m.152850 type:complete len:211 (+) Transcript_77871:111-743(+)